MSTSATYFYLPQDRRQALLQNALLPEYDTVAGATITRLATAEHLAGPGDIVVDLATIASLVSLPDRVEWSRTRSESGERFVLISAFQAEALEMTLPAAPLARNSAQLPPEIPLEKPKFCYRAGLCQETKWPWQSFTACWVNFNRQSPG